VADTASTAASPVTVPIPLNVIQSLVSARVQLDSLVVSVKPVSLLFVIYVYSVEWGHCWFSSTSDSLCKAANAQHTPPTRLNCRVESQRRCVRHSQLVGDSLDELEQICQQRSRVASCRQCERTRRYSRRELVANCVGLHAADPDATQLDSCVGRRWRCLLGLTNNSSVVAKCAAIANSETTEFLAPLFSSEWTKVRQCLRSFLRDNHKANGKLLHFDVEVWYHY